MKPFKFFGIQFGKPLPQPAYNLMVGKICRAGGCNFCGFPIEVGERGFFIGSADFICCSEACAQERKKLEDEGVI